MNNGGLLMLGLIIVFLVFVPFIFTALLIVPQQQVVAIERFGKFSRFLQSGLRFRIPLIEQVAYKLSLRIQQLNIKVETKTKDNVFVNIIVSVQYHVNQRKLFDAAYKLTNIAGQISSYIYDVVRAEVPKLTLDEVFERKDDLSFAIKKELSDVMYDFGYVILKAPVTDVDPDTKVKEAMNEINAAKRMKEAAMENAEAEKIKIVKQAEAEAESKKLQGEGIANQRKAIIEGLKDSIEDFKDSLGIESASEVMNLVLLTQYFDTLKDIGAQSKTNTLLIPHNPGDFDSFFANLRNSIITGNIMSEKRK
jgi:regulator of protease activity HflC (stomatin/prohibitin superfamily)